MTGDDPRQLAMALPKVEERLTWEVASFDTSC